MNISVFGLGYVGAVSAACFFRLGHKIVGVGVVQFKVDCKNGGEAPLKEPGLNEIIYEGVKKERISATTSTEKGILNSEISFICVGTPPKKNGELDLSVLKKVCEEIGVVLRKKENHIVVIRSTMLPGSLDLLKKILEKSSGKIEGKNFHLAVNPEFLREGTAIKDFFNPPYVVVGAAKKNVASKVLKVYSGINSKKFVVKPELAQMIKYASNSWHAVKVSFANEIGVLCKEYGIDSKKLMNLFSEDKQLNISPYYMKPGFAYGGSCLPKDVAAIQHSAKKLNISTPLLDAVSRSNVEHINRAIKLIESTRKKHIGILGITFKADTDDIRGNPVLLVINNLLNKGYDIKIYDSFITKTNLKSIKKSYRKEIYDLISKTDLKDEIMDIENLFSSLKTALNQEVIVISNRDEKIKSVIKNLDKEKIILDLQNILDKNSLNSKAYALV